VNSEHISVTVLKEQTLRRGIGAEAFQQQKKENESEQGCITKRESGAGALYLKKEQSLNV